MIAIDSMILAAGLGQRLLPLTQKTPKPLVFFLTRPLIEYTLDNLQKFCCVRSITINLHYFADKLEEYVRDWFLLKKKTISFVPPIFFSNERNALLETGGAVKHALKTVPELRGAQYLLITNSDNFFLFEERDHVFETLLQKFDHQKMSGLLGVCTPMSMGLSSSFSGDFVIDDTTHLLSRDQNKSNSKNNDKNDNKSRASFIFTGVQIVNVHDIIQYERDFFSFNEIFDIWIREGRLFGHILKNNFFHVGSVQSLTKNEMRARCEYKKYGNAY